MATGAGLGASGAGVATLSRFGAGVEARFAGSAAAATFLGGSLTFAGSLVFAGAAGWLRVGATGVASASFVGSLPVLLVAGVAASGATAGVLAFV